MTDIEQAVAQANVEAAVQDVVETPVNTVVSEDVINEPVVESLDTLLANYLAAKQKVEDAKAEMNSLKAEIDDLIADTAKESLSHNEYGCGTTSVVVGSYDIKCVVQKQVKWDNEKLKAIASDLVERRENPEEYIDCKLSVREFAYKNWPKSLQKIFEPAREVTPSDLTYEVVKIEG